MSQPAPGEESVGRPVVLVTGASGGVGRGIALSCGAAGWTVWVGARRALEGEQVADEVTAAGGAGRFVALDVGDAESVDEALQSIVDRDGRLTGLVHNATSSRSPLPVDPVTVSMADLRDHVLVSMRGAYLLARRAHPLLRATRGSAVFLTSEAGFDGKAKLAPYAAMKGAIRGFGRSLAREWGPDGIRVNLISPLAATPAMTVAMAEDEQMAQRVLGRISLGYVGDSVQDIGPVVRFLLSEESRYLTGNTVMTDGGSCPAT
jgi:3-oxoacyl-[acyl-carrier protein] reductase